jgi:RNA polymerase sigma factor (sigma-70 family)
MASGPLSTFLRHLRRVARPGTARDHTDAQLLERFVRGRDEAAFELLVWRHGTMVLNVCRRVLGREHDAEDAFQATFLTLARKAGTIGKRESLGGWLYRVAYRVALRAGTAPRPRPLPEGPLPDPRTQEPITGLLWREIRSVLDEEVSRLPARYRAAFVLCHLEGRTTEAAARALGCPPGTVGTRLARARALLRRRLARRGFDLSALAVARPGGTAPLAALVDTTVRASRLGTADNAAAAGLISARVAALTKGALFTMTLTNWTLTTAVVLTLALLGGGVALLAHRAQAAERELPAGVARAAAPDAGEDTGPAVAFRFRFQKDQPFDQEVTTTTRQVLKVVGNAVRQEQRQTFFFQWNPAGRRPDGSWLLTQKVTGVKMDIDVGGSKVTFDSSQGGEARSALGDFYRGLVGAEFRVTVAGDGKVQKVEGRDEFLNKALPVSPALGSVWAQAVTADALRRAAEPSFPALPAGPVRPGDSWVRKSDMDLGLLGKYRATHVYTYEGKEGDLDRITVEITLKDRALANPGAGLPFEVKEGALEHASGTGTILFDRRRGRLATLDLDLRLEGVLTIRVGGDEVRAGVSQTQRTTVKTTDTRPLPPSERRGEDATELERLREENQRLRRQLKAVEDALREARPMK